MKRRRRDEVVAEFGVAQMACRWNVVRLCCRSLIPQHQHQPAPAHPRDAQELLIMELCRLCLVDAKQRRERRRREVLDTAYVRETPALKG